MTKTMLPVSLRKSSTTTTTIITTKTRNISRRMIVIAIQLIAVLLSLRIHVADAKAILQVSQQQWIDQSNTSDRIGVSTTTIASHTQRMTQVVVPHIIRLELINSITGTKITDLTNSSIIDISKLNSIGITSPGQLNFRAIMSSLGSFFSVRFSWNTLYSYRIDNNDPYSLCGDMLGTIYDECGKSLSYGTHTITAASFSHRNASGISGNTISLRIKIIDHIVPSPVPVPAPVPSLTKPVSIPVTKPVGLPISLPASTPVVKPIPVPVRVTLPTPIVMPLAKPVAPLPSTPVISKPIAIPSPISAQVPSSPVVSVPTTISCTIPRVSEPSKNKS
jgi:hypothetical protein